MSTQNNDFIDGAVACKSVIVDLIWKQMETNGNR